MARSDNDSWDLATSVGATATVVAAQRAIAARNSLIDDPYAEPLVRAVNADAVTRLLDGGTHQEDGAFTVQQAAEAMAVRTRFYDELFTRAAAAGVRQAVILASGLDTRAYRLRWPTGTIVYELDQPAVIEFKTETLGNLGAHPTAQRRAIGVDLREDWPKALLANGFDRSRPAAWIAEGLTIYLPPEAQDQLFDNITRLSAPGSHVATEYVPDAAVFSDNRSERVLAGYRRSGLDSELSDLVYAGRRSDVLEFLTARGWEMSSQTLEEAYAAHGFALPDNDMFSAFAEARIVTGILT
ncbi:SAM-dependent methyltransferase [Mycolicibacterium celeriflavum]|uniref:class I SAM-dependent methyltransferase n=1 Tax=Mycolicibacterium celeriflavum TaxID=1249101 RepID=UPI000800508B|nr:class I SAM-dependent methyltransferase [Mycolicibacterium celeriflavum]OBG13676.1 SAM-dependent methyltransferase [Mycolicibacterium celeriflavum]